MLIILANSSILFFPKVVILTVKTLLYINVLPLIRTQNSCGCPCEAPFHKWNVSTNVSEIPFTHPVGTCEEIDLEMMRGVSVATALKRRFVI